MELIEKYLSEGKFTVSIKTMVSKYAQGQKEKTVVEKEFDIEKDAKKFVKELMKKYGMQKHAGHIVNYSDSIELFTNY